MQRRLNPGLPHAALFCLCALLPFSAACNRGKPPAASSPSQPGTKRYSLKGKVISIDKNAGTANINNEPIAGFMDPMTMPYTIKPPATIEQLQPGDTITADVVVEPNKYWLENVKVAERPKTPAGKPTSSVDREKVAQENT